MTSLTIYADDKSGSPETITNYQDIASTLKGIGVQLERWQADKILPADADQDTVIAAYQNSIDKQTIWF